jgi:RNase adaptor protein for sRNA GlmZ degradation
MTRVLITGMSGTGKSTALEALARRGFTTVETDDPGWCVPEARHDSDWLWDEPRMAHLLEAHRDTPLFVSGCRPNQGRFYDRFDHVVLFTAPIEVILDRVASRTTNPFGSRPEEREKIIRDTDAFEPILRAGADVLIDTGATSIDRVVATLVALVDGPD